MQTTTHARRAWLSACLTCALSPVVVASAAGNATWSSPADLRETSAETGFDHSSGSSSAALSASCSAGCCTLCPCNYFWAEALILERDNRSKNRPLALDLNTDEVLLSAGDLDFDWSGGVRIGYAFRTCDCWATELVYLGYFQQSATAGVELDDGLMLPDDLGLQVNNFFGADDVGVRYESELHSAELNFVHCCCASDCGGGYSWEWLAGFRYLSLHESAGLTAFDSDESTTTYRVRTRNDLYGAQLGSRLRRCRGCWGWETTAKAGLFGNDMRQLQSPIIDFPDFEFRGHTRGSDGDVAFVGDLNFSTIYQITRRWAVRTGYNLIWIEGVALAPDQLDFSNTQGSGTAVHGGGGVFLHGVNVGLEARW